MTRPKQPRDLPWKGTLGRVVMAEKNEVGAEGGQVSGGRRSCLLGLGHASELMPKEVTCKTGLGRERDSEITVSTFLFLLL